MSIHPTGGSNGSDGKRLSQVRRGARQCITRGRGRLRGAAEAAGARDRAQPSGELGGARRRRPRSCVPDHRPRIGRGDRGLRIEHAVASAAVASIAARDCHHARAGRFRPSARTHSGPPMCSVLPCRRRFFAPRPERSSSRDVRTRRGPAASTPARFPIAGPRSATPGISMATYRTISQSFSRARGRCRLPSASRAGPRRPSSASRPSANASAKRSAWSLGSRPSRRAADVRPRAERRSSYASPPPLGHREPDPEQHSKGIAGTESVNGVAPPHLLSSRDSCSAARNSLSNIETSRIG